MAQFSWRRSGLVIALLFTLTRAPVARAAEAESCDKTLGSQRAKRVVNHCLNVSTATHPPCSTGNACEMIVDHILFMCANNAGPKPPAFCREYTSAAAASARPAPAADAQRLASTAAGDSADASASRQSAAALHRELDSVSASRAQAATKYQADLAEFSKHLRAGNAAYDRFKSTRKAVPQRNTEQLQSANSNYAESARRGDDLVQQFAALEKLRRARAMTAFNSAQPCSRRNSRPMMRRKPRV